VSCDDPKPATFKQEHNDCVSIATHDWAVGLPPPAMIVLGQDLIDIGENMKHVARAHAVVRHRLEQRVRRELNCCAASRTGRCDHPFRAPAVHSGTVPWTRPMVKSRADFRSPSQPLPGER